MTTQTKSEYQPKTGQHCSCKPGAQRDNCPQCEGTGMRIDFAAIRSRSLMPVAKVPASIRYTFDPVTTSAAQRLCFTSPGTVSEQSHLLGMNGGDALIVALDCLIVYAKAHKARFFSPLAEDYVLGPCWLESIKGLRGLFNGDGSVAHFTSRTTDSKDNGTLEAMFWSAMEIAGFSEADL